MIEYKRNVITQYLEQADVGRRHLIVLATDVNAKSEYINNYTITRIRIVEYIVIRISVIDRLFADIGGDLENVTGALIWIAVEMTVSRWKF